MTPEEHMTGKLREAADDIVGNAPADREYKDGSVADLLTKAAALLSSMGEEVERLRGEAKEDAEARQLIRESAALVGRKESLFSRWQAAEARVSELADALAGTESQLRAANVAVSELERERDEAFDVIEDDRDWSGVTLARAVRELIVEWSHECNAQKSRVSELERRLGEVDAHPSRPMPDVEEVARLIGSYVVHDDHGGPDTEVLQDVIGGDYDESLRRVHELAQAILSLFQQDRGKG